MRGWQSFGDHSGDAFRPEILSAFARADATAPSTRLASSCASFTPKRCSQCSPHTIAHQWQRSEDGAASATSAASRRKVHVRRPKAPVRASTPTGTETCAVSTCA